MKRLLGLLALSVWLLAFIGNVGGNPNPLTFWWYAGDPTVLRPAIECALERVRAATCLPVDVSLDAHVWVRQKTPEQMGVAYGQTYGDFDRIAIRNTATHPCDILVHEIGQHVLRRRADHAGSTNNYLSEGLVFDICARFPCGCQVPEPGPYGE